MITGPVLSGPWRKARGVVTVEQRMRDSAIENKGDWCV